MRRALTAALAIAALVLAAWRGPTAYGTVKYAYDYYVHSSRPHHPVEPETAALRVLWVGNSHSWRHRVVAAVQDEARERGTGPLYVDWMLAGNLRAAKAGFEARLATRDFDAVVLQGCSRNANHAPEVLAGDLDWMRERIGQRVPRVVLYETWPYGPPKQPGTDQATLDGLFCRVSGAYDGRARVAWIGAAFERARLAGIEGVSSDGIHASIAGARIAGRLLYAALTDEPADLDGLGLSEADRHALDPGGCP